MEAGAAVSLRRALAAVGAVNLETNERVEPAFFGFSSVPAADAGEGGVTTFLVSKATLGTLACLVTAGVASLLSTAVFLISVGFLIPAFFKTGSFFLSASSWGAFVLRKVVCCLLIGVLGLSSFLLLTEETLFAGLFLTLVVSLIFSSTLVPLEVVD